MTRWFNFVNVDPASSPATLQSKCMKAKPQHLNIYLFCIYRKLHQINTSTTEVSDSTLLIRAS